MHQIAKIDAWNSQIGGLTQNSQNKPKFDYLKLLGDEMFNFEQYLKFCNYSLNSLSKKI